MDRRPPFQVSSAPRRATPSLSDRPLGTRGLSAKQHADRTFMANLRTGMPFVAVPLTASVPRRAPVPTAPYYTEAYSRYERSPAQEGEATGVMRRQRNMDTGRAPHAESGIVAHRIVNEQSEMANQIRAELQRARQIARADSTLHGLRGTTEVPYSGFRPPRAVASHASSAPPRTAVAHSVPSHSAVVPPFATGFGRSRPNAWLDLVARVRRESGVSQKEAMKLASTIYRS